MTHLIHGTVTSTPGIFGDAEKTEYDCFLIFSDYENHLPILKDFLAIAGVDIDAESSWRVVNDWNCSRALVWDYFRQQYQQFIDDGQHPNVISDSQLPIIDPTIISDQHKLWIVKLNSKQIQTPKSAAYLLYQECRSQKMQVGDAKRLIGERFKGYFFSWDEVLREFRELSGARTTDKYLRIENY